MHKGRAYPYHPSYWATECFFYPGFLPWKLTLDVTATGTPPWNIYPALYQEISNPGTISPGGQRMVYEFVAHAAFYGLIVTIETFFVSGVKNARWKMQLVSGVAGWAMAINFQPSPIRQVFNNTWPIFAGSIPYPVVGAPPYLLRPATYIEGGSPWPNIGPP